ncbi:MAG: LysR family transcriptional regulator [Pseudomonadales bacterium]
MNRHELEAFLEVADLGSFSRAAERLHLTQPAVSKRIQALEQQLKTRLFDRVGQIDVARLLQPRAQALLRDMDDTRRVLRDLDLRVAGVLSLATSHHVGLHRLAPVLREFIREYPDVQLDIRFEDSEAAHELVRAAAAEIAVVTLNPKGDADLDCRVLWDDPLSFVVAADHELARRDAPLSLAELAASHPVLPGPATYTGRIVLEAFAAAGIRLTPTLATNYLETIAMLVSTGLGWSVLPRNMSGTALSVPLVALDTEAPPLRRSLGSVCNPRRTLSNAAQAFLGVLLRHADGAA